MGFLDLFDNPDIMQSLLGIAGPDQNAPPPPPPMPPSQSPQSTEQIAGLPSPMPQPPVGVMGAPSVDEAGMAQAPQGVPLPRPAPGGMTVQPKDATFAQRFDASNPGMPIRSPAATDEGGMIQGMPGAGAMAQVPRPPVSAPAPAGPAALPPGAKPTSGASPTGGLEGALGINPSMMGPNNNGPYNLRPTNPVLSAMAGLGKGLTAVGHQPLGTSKGAAFAAGAGGALEGVAGDTEKQQNDTFNQASTAFKDMMLAKNSDDMAGYRAAQQQWLIARAKSVADMTGKGAGRGGSAAWMATPEGRLAQADALIEKSADRMRKTAEFNAKSKGEAIDNDALNKEIEAERNRVYKSRGIDPNQAEKIKTMGMREDNPFPTPKSQHELYGRVPPGGYYDTGNKYPASGVYTTQAVGPDGKPSGKTLTYRGKPGAPVIAVRPTDAADWQAPQGAPAPGQRSNLEDYEAERMALTPAA